MGLTDTLLTFCRPTFEGNYNHDAWCLETKGSVPFCVVGDLVHESPLLKAPVEVLGRSKGPGYM